MGRLVVRVSPELLIHAVEQLLLAVCVIQDASLVLSYHDSLVAQGWLIVKEEIVHEGVRWQLKL